jgi:hypothetical protein
MLKQLEDFCELNLIKLNDHQSEVKLMFDGKTKVGNSFLIALLYHFDKSAQTYSKYLDTK